MNKTLHYITLLCQITRHLKLKLSNALTTVAALNELTCITRWEGEVTVDSHCLGWRNNLNCTGCISKIKVITMKAYICLQVSVKNNVCWLRTLPRNRNLFGMPIDDTQFLCDYWLADANRCQLIIHNQFFFRSSISINCSGPVLWRGGHYGEVEV